MLHRLGMGGKTGRECFTKCSLSRVLHTRPDEIQKWIDLGWLKSRALTTAGTKANIIHADDFCEFVKEHGRAVASRRLSYDALWFVQNYVFPAQPRRIAVVARNIQKGRSRRCDRPEHGISIGQRFRRERGAERLGFVMSAAKEIAIVKVHAVSSLARADG
jgi:hypothetical protein